jgi:NAD(P)H dehydrogenase (quinone)
MRVLTVFAHPIPGSFCHAVRDRFLEGLREAGHQVDLADLYAEKFDPVLRAEDMAVYVDENVPGLFERMHVREKVVAQAGSPILRALARRWIRNRSDAEVAAAIRARTPKDVLRAQERVAMADGLAFISPVYWLGFPAIMKGWVERVLGYGTAYRLDASGWDGHASGRVPLLRKRKALVINTTFFREDDYEPELARAMRTTIDSWALRYPGVAHVEHRYLWAVEAVGPEIRRKYLEDVFALGRDFDVSGAAPRPPRSPQVEAR